MLQNPHHCRPRAPRRLQDLGAGPISAKKLAQRSPFSSISAKKLAQHSPSSGISAKKLAQQAQKRRFWGVLTAQGELFRAHAHIRPRRANFFAHRTQPRGDVETAISSATADAGQHETTITTARPQQGTAETAITSATEKHAKNTHFSPAKAMAVSFEARPPPAKATWVSIPHEHERAKAMAVSDKRAAWLAGSGCATSR